MSGAYTTVILVGGWGPLEIAMLAMNIVILILVAGVIWVIAKRAVSSSLPGYGFDAERVSDDEVEVTVTGAGTASVIRFVVDGEVRGEVDAEPGASAIVQVAEDEEITARKVGGN